MKSLKVQVDAKVAGVLVAPSAKMPLKGSVKLGGVSYPADTLVALALAASDQYDQDGGQIDGDADINFTSKVKVPIVGTVDIDGHITVSVVD